MPVINQFRALTSWLVVLLATGCGGGDSTSLEPEQFNDSIRIQKLTPASAKAGESTTFLLEVSYALNSVPQGVIDVGFFINDTTTRLTGTKKFISEGTGTAAFTVTVVPSDFTSTSAFGVRVFLSEEPHPETWSPTASDMLRIPLTP